MRSDTASVLESGLESGGAGFPDMSLFYRVQAPADRLQALAQELNAQEAVEAAFVKPPAYVPQINDMAPSSDDAPPASPDFTSRQLYLNAAPVGVDARYAWTVPGGGGAGVRVIDIEGAWRFTHEDLRLNQGGVVGGTQSTDLGWRNHGTAVVGVIGADRNAFGVTGITPTPTPAPSPSSPTAPPGPSATRRTACRRATFCSSSCTAPARASTSRRRRGSAALSRWSGGRTTSRPSSTRPAAG